VLCTGCGAYVSLAAHLCNHSQHKSSAKLLLKRSTCPAEALDTTAGLTHQPLCHAHTSPEVLQQHAAAMLVNLVIQKTVHWHCTGCARPACFRACTASKGDCAAGSHTKSCCWGSLYGQKGDVPDSTHNWTVEQLHNSVQHALQGSMPHDHTSPCLQSAHLVACERPLTTASDGGSNDLCNNQQPLLL
jgi:hypothetical protein